MKKLNLKSLKLNSDDVLQRERLKSIFGGANGYPPPGSGDTCYTTCIGSAQCVGEHGIGWFCMPISCEGDTYWHCRN